MSVLLNGCTTWTFTKCMEKKLDGNYTKMLHAVLNKSWKQQLYSHLPHITKTTQVRWARYAEHCWRRKDKVISNVLLWTPIHGHTSVGLPVKAYIHQLCADTGCRLDDQQKLLANQVKKIHAVSMPWWWFVKIAKTLSMKQF